MIRDMTLVTYMFARWHIELFRNELLVLISVTPVTGDFVVVKFFVLIRAQNILVGY